MSLREKLFGLTVGSVGYGCRREDGERLRIVSTGALRGCCAQVAYYPSRDVATVLLMNIEDADLYKAADEYLCGYVRSVTFR